MISYNLVHPEEGRAGGGGWRSTAGGKGAGATEGVPTILTVVG